MCRLQKLLYGLKQASRQWNLKLSQALLDIGFKQSHQDHSMIVLNEGSEVAIMLVYVDDILFTRSDITLLQNVKIVLKTTFKIKDLGDLKYFLGIEVFDQRKESS